MENRLRDLEQIRERDTDDSARRIGLIALASISVMGVIFALGVVVGRAVRPDANRVDDPLARVDRLSQVAPPTKAQKEPPVRIRQEELSFPSILVQKRDPPEVAAAIAAAAAEEAELKAKLARGAEASTTQVALRSHLPEPPLSVQPLEKSAPKPAATLSPVNESKLSNLARSNTGFPRVPAQVGQAGDFTIQVISYERRDPAEAFAAGLRSRGHRAFVVGVDVPGRGTYWRVRIGPFDSQWRAEAYLAKFEQEERMNAIVVKKPKK
jgi:DedD protein